MALKSTIFKAQISISDLNRHYYQSQTLTIARHPSETDERMMIRLLAFILNANNELTFTKGLSTDDEPDLWQKSLVGEIELWVELGLPSEKRILKACHQSKKVIIYTYQGRLVSSWLEKNSSILKRFDKLSIYEIKPEHSQQLPAMVDRQIDLQCTIDGQTIWLNSNQCDLEIPIVQVK